MLIFGGSKFKEQEPNDKEYTDKCLLLTISATANHFTLTHLPGCKLREPDKFFGNMQASLDINKNTVTVIG